LLDRKYVERREKNLLPTELGGEVVELLDSSFKRIMDVAFTARMEEDLDGIEQGNSRWQELLQVFYADFRTELENAEKGMRDLRREVVPTGESCEKCGKPLVIRRGRFGKFISCSGYPACTYKRNLAADGTAKEPQPAPQMLDETCDKCGSAMVLRRGRYGPFKACSNYPKCKNTKAVPNPVGVACPSPGCTGQVAMRFTKSRRPFYGCTNWPTCKFMSWPKPTGQRCPVCQAFLVERRRKGVAPKAVCSTKGCTHSEDLPAEADAPPPSIAPDSPQVASTAGDHQPS
jgi:DNA topoisomerase-1